MGKSSSTKAGTSSRASSEAPSVVSRSETPSFVARSETPTVAGQQETFGDEEDVDILTRKFHDFTLADELQSQSMLCLSDASDLQEYRQSAKSGQIST